ncbi:MAG: hypothetical protein JNJ60_04060 [Rhodocyclaceae bacterium]|nr:hypothetical protein [Rhodocyclaceae bacterium]
MLNRDINSRFEDWLLSPSETLDFEVKQWLDLEDQEAQGLVAKALIALENHGGGFLLFGYLEDENKKLVPDPNRPASLEPYLTDRINAIVKRRAEPSFHVEVTLQRHPESGDEYPLVRVTGQSRVPVRSDSATPGNSLRQNVYYIRAPGPESRAPLNASEWDALLQRVIANQRDEIVGLLRSLFPSGGAFGGPPPPTESELLDAFVKTAAERWATLNDALATDHPARVKLGHYLIAARLVGTSKNASAQSIIEANQSARRYTGWPAFVTIHQDNTRPRLVDGCIEAWVAQANYPDVGHADFWRIDPKGNFLLLRGYQEDSLDPARGFGAPGTLFEATLPVWRVGEFLLRVAELASVMCEDGFGVAVSCQWHGLRDRKLFVHNMRRFLRGNYRSSADYVHTTGQFAVSAIRELLPDVVKSLTSPLYEHFDFFTPPDAFYREELGEMLKNRF